MWYGHIRSFSGTVTSWSFSYLSTNHTTCIITNCNVTVKYCQGKLNLWEDFKSLQGDLWEHFDYQTNLYHVFQWKLRPYGSQESLLIDLRYVLRDGVESRRTLSRKNLIRTLCRSFAVQSSFFSVRSDLLLKRMSHSLWLIGYNSI